jgi:hypothetical protein
MPKLNETFDNAQESTAGGGEFKRMQPGIYQCIITGIDTEWETRAGLQKAEERQCVRVRLDVAEGEFAGEFSRDFYLDKPWMRSIFMSWSERALGMLKHTLKALDEANPGFDSRAAFEADQWMLFIGKKCRVLWNGTERTSDRGYTNVNVRPDRIVTADENPEPKVELERGGTVKWSDYQQVEGQQPTAQAATGAAYSSEDVPF